MERVRRLLRRAGVMPGLADVDWDATCVFSTRFGMNLYVNAVGKFPQGIVTTQEYETLCAEVTSRLLALRVPGGGEVVRRVHRVSAGRAEAIVAPDMIVEYHNFYDPQSAPDRQRAIRGLDGSHVVPGVLVLHGPHVRSGETLADSSIVDVAPTVLRLLGVPVPPDMDGRVIGEALTAGAGVMHEGSSAFSVPDKAAEYSPIERLQVEEQLRSLGYIE